MINCEHGGGWLDGWRKNSVRVMSVANGLSLKPPQFTEGRAPLGGRAILARPQTGPIWTILRVKSAKMRVLRLRADQVAFKPSAASRSEASASRHLIR
jgi:hypothetical protein